jgi:hypothetical protein
MYLKFRSKIRSKCSQIRVGLYLYGSGYSLSRCWILVMTNGSGSSPLLHNLATVRVFPLLENNLIL